MNFFSKKISTQKDCAVAIHLCVHEAKGIQHKALLTFHDTFILAKARPRYLGRKLSKRTFWRWHYHPGSVFRYSTIVFGPLGWNILMWWLAQSDHTLKVRGSTPLSPYQDCSSIGLERQTPWIAGSNPAPFTMKGWRNWYTRWILVPFSFTEGFGLH